MKNNSKIYVAGHRGLVGSAIVRRLEADGYHDILTRSHKQLDLMEQTAVRDFFSREKPEYVFLAAAMVGGIHANNTYPADFIHNNLTIQNNVLHESYMHGVKKLLFLGSSCIYPRLVPQPIKEDYLMTGPLEPTNSPYAVAKIAGIEMWLVLQPAIRDPVCAGHCPQISMVRMIISILRIPMSCLPSCESSMKQRKHAKIQSPSGEPGNPKGNFFMSMIWRMPVFS